MEEQGVEKVYMDKQSGKDFNRPQYQEMISNLQKGDVVVLHSLDRLGRNYDEIIQEWSRITKEIEADIIVLDMPLLNTTISQNDLTGRFMADLVLQILSYVSETERQNIKKRQAEGIAIAKEQGKYKGRAKKDIDMELFNENKKLLKAGKISKVEFANILGVSRPTLDKLLKEN